MVLFAECDFSYFGPKIIDVLCQLLQVDNKAELESVQNSLIKLVGMNQQGLIVVYSFNLTLRKCYCNI